MGALRFLLVWIPLTLAMAARADEALTHGQRRSSIAGRPIATTVRRGTPLAWIACSNRLFSGRNFLTLRNVEGEEEDVYFDETPAGAMACQNEATRLQSLANYPGSACGCYRSFVTGRMILNCVRVYGNGALRVSIKKLRFAHWANGGLVACNLEAMRQRNAR